jgi:hypothetical protein
MPTPADLPDRPVFVDPSGRRRRLVRRLAIAACALLATYTLLLCGALSGAPIPPSALLPLPGMPTTVEPTMTTGQDGEQPAVTTSIAGRTSQAAGGATTTSVSAPTLTSQPTGPTLTTTATTGNRNSHAPTTAPGRTKHTSTTTATP